MPALPHAETPSLIKVVALRAGCGTAAPRAGGVKHRRPDAVHPGKTIDKGRRRKRAFTPGFFFVFIAPVGSLSVSLKPHAENVCSFSFLNRRTGAGLIALPRGVRGRGAPCSVSPSKMRKEVCTICFFHRRKGAGPMALLPGVRGRIGPCPIVPPSNMRKEEWKSRLLHRRMGPGAMPLVRGVRRPPAPSSPQSRVSFISFSHARCTAAGCAVRAAWKAAAQSGHNRYST